MDQDENSRLADKSNGGGPKLIISEEEGESRSSPRKDLIAAAFLTVLSVFAMALASRLPNPGGPLTHPGLLPFLTGLTLLAMAAGLGFSAVRDGGAKALFQRIADGAPDVLGHEDARRTLLLVAIIGLYVLLADLVTFDLRYPMQFFVVHFSSYEAISIGILTMVLRIFWRAPLWRCLLVSVVFVIALASVFRHGFHILLPGAD